MASAPQSGILTLPRLWIFAAIGWSLPLYAFPIATVLHRRIDAATILAAALALACAPAILAGGLSRGTRLLCIGAALVPLLALTPLGPPSLARGAFASSYAHWILMIAVFAAAQTLRLSPAQRGWLAGSQVVVGCCVALFALYQIEGIPRRWPAVGPVLVSIQREPMRFDSAPGYVRATGTFLEPAWLGGYLAWVLSLAIVLLPSREKRRLALTIRVAAVVILLLALLATVSWGAYADLAAGLVVGAVTLRRDEGRRLLKPLGAAVLAALLLLFVSSAGRHVVGALQSRLTALVSTPLRTEALESEIRDTSWVRYQNLRHTWDLFLAHPVAGVGLGQFNRYAGSPRKLQFVYPWCGWLAIAAQMGVLGPVLLVVAFLLVARRWRCLALDEPLRLGVPVLLGVAAAMQLHTGSFIDLWWWFPMSLAAALSGRSCPGTERMT